MEKKTFVAVYRDFDEFEIYRVNSESEEKVLDKVANELESVGYGSVCRDCISVCEINDIDLI